MAASIILGLAAIRRRDIDRHRTWMTRAYALALGRKPSEDEDTI